MTVPIGLLLAIGAFSLLAQADEVGVSGNDRVAQRVQVYDRGTWTIAYVPEAPTGERAPYGREYHILKPNRVYQLQSQQSPSNYCFLVSHRSADFANQPSYLGVASLSALSDGTNPTRPVSMFRNRKWRLDGGEVATTFEASKLTPARFFSAHVKATSPSHLDDLLGHQWHAWYGDGARDHSWNHRDRWDLPRELATLNNGEFVSADLDNTRFDAKLIRFKFTGSSDSRYPPTFCIRRQDRLMTFVKLVSPHLAEDLSFSVKFP